MMPFIPYLVKINKLKLKFFDSVGNVFIGRLPNNIIKRNVRSILYSYKTLQQYVEEYKKIRNGDVEKYFFPPDFPVFFVREKSFEDRYIYYLQNVNVSIYSGLIWTKTNEFLQESIGSLNRMLNWNDVRPLISLPRRKFIKTEGSVYYFFPTAEFYHFLLEELPALLYVFQEHKETLKIIVNAFTVKKYQLDILKLLFGDSYKSRIVQANTNLLIERLVLVQRDEYSGFVYSRDLNLLNNFMRGFVKPQNEKFKKIYISRRKAIKRRIANEKELESLLELQDFSIVFLEDLSISQQIDLIWNSETVVSIHGAGLSHLVWGSITKKVIEIFPSNYMNDCFARISICKGFDYSYVFCNNNNGMELIPLEKVMEHIVKKDALLMETEHL